MTKPKEKHETEQFFFIDKEYHGLDALKEFIAKELGSEVETVRTLNNGFPYARLKDRRILSLYDRRFGKDDRLLKTPYWSIWAIYSEDGVRLDKKVDRLLSEHLRKQI